jgi:hypothetical protein
LGLLLWKVVYNLFAGPFPVDEQALAAIDRPGSVSRYFVTFEAKNYRPTDVTVRTDKDPTPFAAYVLVPVQDRWLVVRRYTSQKGDILTGTLAAPSAEERDKVFGSQIRRAPGRKEVLPYVVDANQGVFYMGAVAELVLLLVPLGLGGWLVVRALRRTWRPERHPIARALARFGTPREVADAIEQETGAVQRLRVGPVEFRGRWLLCRALGQGYKVFCLDDLVWVYKLIMRINGVPHYWARLFDRHGESFQVRSSENRVNAILSGVAVQAPWLITGYGEALEQAWKSNPASLIGAVEQRRQKFFREQGPPAEPPPENEISRGPEDRG